MNNSVIFLDIDGVLKDPFEQKWYQNSIDLINDYCLKSSSKIVISSDWRLHKSKTFFNKILNGQVIGMTKDLSSMYSNYVRYYECIQYAKKHKINNYIFIDDKPSQFLKHDRLIVTDPLVGICFKDIYAIDKLISSSPEFKQISIFEDIEDISY